MAKKYGHVNKIYKQTELRLILIESTTFSLFQPMRAGHRVNDKAPPPPPHKLTNDPVGFNIMQALYIRFIFLLFYITIACLNKVLFLSTITSLVWSSREFAHWCCICCTSVRQNRHFSATGG